MPDNVIFVQIIHRTFTCINLFNAQQSLTTVCSESNQNTSSIKQTRQSTGMPRHPINSIRCRKDTTICVVCPHLRANNQTTHTQSLSLKPQLSVYLSVGYQIKPYTLWRQSLAQHQNVATRNIVGPQRTYFVVNTFQTQQS